MGLILIKLYSENDMPLYRISTRDGALSREEKAALAAEITEFHYKMAGLDKAFVKLIFETFAADDGFVGGQPGAAVVLTVLIRAGRSSEYKRNMLLELWSMLQRATGAADVDMLVAIEEAPASQAMEMGQIMPDLDA